MEKLIMGQGQLDDLLTSPKPIHEDQGFKGMRRIDKEQLPQNVQNLCDTLGTKLVQVLGREHVVMDITPRAQPMVDMMSEMHKYEDYDLQTLHTFFQRKLLETLYPNKKVVYLGVFEEDDKVENIQESSGNTKGQLKFFAAHDGKFGIGIWNVT